MLLVDHADRLGVAVRATRPEIRFDNPAYLEPGLAAQPGELVSVIVTAQSAERATAVRRLGGQVTSELWLIDAVAARLQPGQLDRLADLLAFSQLSPISLSPRPGKNRPPTPTPTPTSTPTKPKKTTTEATPTPAKPTSTPTSKPTSTPTLHRQRQKSPNLVQIPVQIGYWWIRVLMAG